jgi:hypothetical protein
LFARCRLGTTTREEEQAMAGPRRGKRGDNVRKSARILIVEARYYDDIADALLAGAMKALQEAGAEVDGDTRRHCHRHRCRALTAPAL